MKIYLKYIFIYIVLIFLTSETIYSQSIFSTIGLGQIRYFINTRSTGMGYTGLAVNDELSYNRVNPANSTSIKNTSFGAGFVFEGIKISQKNNSLSSSLSRFNGGSLSIKIKDGIVITGGLYPYSDYEFEFYSRISDANYSTNLIGNGGLSAGSGGIGVKITEELSLGFSLNRLFGRLEEQTLIDFDDLDYIDTRDNVDKILYGNYFTSGFTYKISEKIKTGGFFSTGTKLNGRIEFKHIYEKAGESPKINIKLPYSFGLGGTYKLNPKTIFGADLLIFKGSQFKDNNADVDFVKDAYRICFGGEITPSSQIFDEYLKKMSYRVGFFVNSPYLKDIDNSPIKEYFITCGLGFPFNRNRARLDFALELGMRGSRNNDLASEKIIRFAAGFSSSEAWFLKRPK